MTKPECRKDLDYITQQGEPLTATQIIDSETEDDIVAITSDDRLVLITNCYRLSVGAAGTGEGTRVSESVEFTELLPPQAGLYRTIKEGAAYIHAEVTRRMEKGKAYKQWSQIAWTTLAIMSENPDELAEVLEDGLEDYLSTI
ncbi:MAG: hypothetical protein GY833_23055 [Aestuariibacter sp.]|nr:hypothetical protein [Aestuariibacter sp.]|tara:strand:+ start:176135 stop:176563 length:429 start_codon:yes stop_codon:yes gene_type:complete